MLTNEELRRKFKNNFDLCNFSISIARAIILGGNPATLNQILAAVSQRVEENEEKASIHTQTVISE